MFSGHANVYQVAPLFYDTHVYKYKYKYMYMYMYMKVYIHVYTCIYVYIYIHVYIIIIAYGLKIVLCYFNNYISYSVLYIPPIADPFALGDVKESLPSQAWSMARKTWLIVLVMAPMSLDDSFSL